ncbi:uncharacterized protein LOC133815644 [Humulus lupulus]|uniref:uncharacterized protein LOC133815644 n=1 Tax=Humulus lupulus TaxID=3486 RepID=UPI002B407409|nr:uncharacterized protein LOC133815644 [Humulus lupulus]
MDDLRVTATAYHEFLRHETKLAIKAFAEEMETKEFRDKIKFDDFSKYMSTIGFPHFGSQKFFDQLRREDRDHLVYADIVTLLYIIQSGRPFCQGKDCANNKLIITGVYFTCVKCFLQHCDYHFNVCPNCFYNERYEHPHKEFLDPMVMLRLKAKQDQSNGVNNNNTTYCSDKNMNKASGSTSSAASSSNAIVPNKPQPKTKNNTDRALQLMQMAVGLGNLVAATTTLCTIL